MIQQTLLSALFCALAVNMIRIHPWYIKLIAPKYKEEFLGTSVGKAQFDELTNKFENQFPKDVIISLFNGKRSIDDLGVPTKEYNFYRTYNYNPYSSKPFNCTYCLAFWLAFMSYFFWPLVYILFFDSTLGMFRAGVMFVAPFLAVLFERIYEALPVTLKH